MAKVKAAGLFLVNKEDKILIGHPTNHDPEFWSIPKGKIDEGEKPLDAAIRETFEESNIQLSKETDTFVYLGKYVYRHKKKDIMLYSIFEDEDGTWADIEVKCNSNVPEERGGFPEMDDFKWVTIDEARILLHNTQVDALDVLEEKLELRDDKYDRIWCGGCLTETPHRKKLGAVMYGNQVCNVCDKMNPM